MSGFLDDVHIDLPGGGRRRRPVKPIKRKLPVNTAGGVKVVIWHVIRCPECGGKNAPCYATKRPLRYHKCKDCGAMFKSVEQ